ncbi:MAG: hypothetical protein KGS72_04625 [Cyanobacteria bacterium REEB67]|nr:hypothetical protein [Cyanobacteria bacterium REEB67]
MTAPFFYPVLSFPFDAPNKLHALLSKLKLGNNPLPFINHHVTVFRYQQCHHRSQSFSLDPFSSSFLAHHWQYPSETIPKSKTNPNSSTTAYLYNSSRWRIQSTEPAPFSLETGYGYDLIGNQTSTSRQTGGFPAGQATSTSYSTLNKPLQVVDPLGHPTSFGYDVFGRRISTLDAENHLRRYILDGNGRLSQIIDANGVAEETRGLYPGGPVHTIADAGGNTSTFIRDGIARLTQITYPDSSTEIWTLDAIGNVSSLKTRGGKTIGQTFDGCSRVLKRSPQDQPVVSYSYDFAGRLLTASTSVVSGDASSGSFSRAYDSAGRLISETDSQGAVIGYQLDANGNVTRITYPSGYYVTRAYDQLDRVTKITLYTDTTPAATFTYDGLDRRLALNFPKTGGETAYSFDIGNNRLSTDIVSGSTSLGLSYQYNKVNQMIYKKTSDATYEWLLSTAASITYGTASNLNAYPTVGGVTQVYDTAGRLTNDVTFTYVYNTEGMLTQVKNASGTAVVASYAYDPFKRLVLKTVTTPSSVTRYVYSGTQLMEEYNCSGGLPGTLIRRYVYASPGEAIFQIDASGNVTYLLNDHQGSLIAQANGSGTVLNKYTYSPFGENTGLPGSVIGYTGQRYDAETGLYYYKARHYKPSIGRFLQPDPIGYAAGMNMYGYVHNDPVNRTDPMGTVDFWKSFSAAYDEQHSERVAAAFAIGSEIMFSPETGGGSLAGIPSALKSITKGFGRTDVNLEGAAEEAVGLATSITKSRGVKDAMDSVIDSVRGVSGTYAFPDNLAKGKIYEGKAVDLGRRLEEHIESGKLSRSDVGAVAVRPGDTHLENTFINWRGGPMSANPDTNASNKIFAPGARKLRD